MVLQHRIFPIWSHDEPEGESLRIVSLLRAELSDDVQPERLDEIWPRRSDRLGPLRKRRHSQANTEYDRLRWYIIDHPPTENPPEPIVPLVPF